MIGFDLTKAPPSEDTFEFERRRLSGKVETIDLWFIAFAFAFAALGLFAKQEITGIWVAAFNGDLKPYMAGRGVDGAIWIMFSVMTALSVVSSLAPFLMRALISHFSEYVGLERRGFMSFYKAVVGDCIERIYFFGQCFFFVVVLLSYFLFPDRSLVEDSSGVFGYYVLFYVSSLFIVGVVSAYKGAQRRQLYALEVSSHEDARYLKLIEACKKDQALDNYRLGVARQGRQLVGAELDFLEVEIEKMVSRLKFEEMAKQSSAVTDVLYSSEALVTSGAPVKAK